MVLRMPLDLNVCERGNMILLCRDMNNGRDRGEGAGGGVRRSALVLSTWQSLKLVFFMPSRDRCCLCVYENERGEAKNATCAGCFTFEVCHIEVQ